jgi:hypothetical protein
MDTSLNRVLRRKVADDMVDITEKFCRAAGYRHVMLRLEDTFMYYLDSYVKAALLEEGRYAHQYREELCRIITRAREITNQEREKALSK